MGTDDDNDGDYQLPVPLNFGAMLPYPLRLYPTPKQGTQFPADVGRDLAFGSMALLNSILSNPYAHAGGFKINITSEEDEIMNISGHVTERTYQIHCPYCCETFEVTQVEGRYNLRCSVKRYFNGMGFPFRVVIKSTRYGHKIWVG